MPEGTNGSKSVLIGIILGVLVVTFGVCGAGYHYICKIRKQRREAAAISLQPTSSASARASTSTSAPRSAPATTSGSN